MQANAGKRDNDGWRWQAIDDGDGCGRPDGGDGLLRGLWARFHARTVGGAWQSAFHRPKPTVASRQGVSDGQAQADDVGNLAGNQPRRKSKEPTSTGQRRRQHDADTQHNRVEPRFVKGETRPGCVRSDLLVPVVLFRSLQSATCGVILPRVGRRPKSWPRCRP